MRILILAIALMPLIGCGSETVSEQPATEQKDEQSYAEALQVYRTEKEILDDLYDDRQFFSEAVERYEKEIDEMIRSEVETHGGMTFSEVKKAMSQQVREGKARISKQSKEDVAMVDEKIAEQKAKVERAKSELEAAEARKER